MKITDYITSTNKYAKHLAEHGLEVTVTLDQDGDNPDREFTREENLFGLTVNKHHLITFGNCDMIEYAIYGMKIAVSARRCS